MPMLTPAELIAVLSLIVSVVAVLSAPLIAHWVGQRTAREEEKRKLKLVVFGTLLQSRHDPISQEAVKHLNLIDLVFHDIPKVRDGWSQYYALLSDPRLDNDAGFAVRDDKRRALLQLMADAIGYADRITTSDLIRTYRPQAEAERQELEIRERRLRLGALRSLQDAPPSAVASTPEPSSTAQGSTPTAPSGASKDDPDRPAPTAPGT